MDSNSGRQTKNRVLGEEVFYANIINLQGVDTYTVVISNLSARSERKERLQWLSHYLQQENNGERRINN